MLKAMAEAEVIGYLCVLTMAFVSKPSSNANKDAFNEEVNACPIKPKAIVVAKKAEFEKVTCPLVVCHSMIFSGTRVAPPQLKSVSINRLVSHL